MSPRQLLIRILFWGGGALALYLLWPCLLLFLIAWGTACAVEPLVRRLTAWKIPRQLAAGLVLTALLGLAALVLWLLLSRLAYETGQLLLRLPAMTAQVRDYWLEERLYALLVASPPELRGVLETAAERLVSDGLRLPDRLSAGLTAAAGQLAAAMPGLFLAFTTGILAVFYCSADLPGVRRYLTELIPEDRRPAVFGFVDCLRRAALDWCRVQGRLMGIVFAILAAGLLLLRIPCAVLAAGLGALIDALPFFGSGILLLPWALVSLVQGEAVRAGGLVVLYGLLCFTRGMLEPRFYGKQAGVSPLLTLLALYGGFRLFGVWGMLLAPIALSISASVLREREKSVG